MNKAHQKIAIENTLMANRIMLKVSEAQLKGFSDWRPVYKVSNRKSFIETTKTKFAELSWLVEICAVIGADIIEEWMESW